MVIVVLHEDPPPSPTFRHLLLLFVLPLSLKVIVVLQKDPPPSPTFRHLRICVLSLSLMVIDVSQEVPPLSPTFRRLLLPFVLPLGLMVIVILHSDTFYCYLYFH